MTTENYVPKLQRLAISTSATAVLVAGVAGKRTAVHGLTLQSAATSTSKLNDESAHDLGTFDVSGAPLVLRPTQLPYLVCDDGDDLSITISGADLNTGVLLYTQE